MTMSSEYPQTSSRNRPFIRFVKRILIAVVAFSILAAGCCGAGPVVRNKPKAGRRRPPSLTPVVEVAPLQRGREQIVVDAMGTVKAARQVTLQSEVPGRIVRLHPQLTEGGMVRRDDVLVWIEDADYRLALKQKEAALEQAGTELMLEQGRQDVALHEWEALREAYQADDLEMELALRKPQLRARQAAVKAAEAEVEKARLNLARTRVRAPFNAVIRDAPVDVGDVAGTQTPLAELVYTDAFEVEVSVPVSKLKWIDLGSGDADGAGAQVFASSGAVWPGKVVRLLSDLEPRGRMARLLLEVRDPLGRTQANDDARVPLLLGEYVRASIRGTRLDDVITIPRTAYRDGEEVWLVDEQSHLQIEPVAPLWSDRTRILVPGDALPDYRLVVSDLAIPLDGMAVRVSGADASLSPEANRGKRAAVAEYQPDAERDNGDVKVRAD